MISKSVLYISCDILTALYLKSYKYLFISLLIPSDSSSLENFILCLIDYDCCFEEFLPYISIFYYPVVNFWYGIDVNFNAEQDAKYFIKQKSFLAFLYYLLSFKIECKEYDKIYRTCHLPSFGITWFNFLHIFYENSFLVFNILNIGYIYAILKFKYFLKLNKLKKPTNYQKSHMYKFILIFKQSTFKNYLIYIIKSRFLFVYCILYVIWRHVYFLVHSIGIGNPNFMFWINVIFLCVFLYDVFGCKLKVKK